MKERSPERLFVLFQHIHTNQSCMMFTSLTEVRALTDKNLHKCGHLILDIIIVINTQGIKHATFQIGHATSNFL